MTGEIVKHVCPEHQIELVPRDTRKYGVRWECPIRGCSVAWWGRDTASPADAKTRKARKDFASEFLSLPEELGAQVMQWFEENNIAGPGFLTEGEANVGLQTIRKLRNDAHAAALRTEVANAISALSEAGQIQFARRCPEEWVRQGITLRETTDLLVLTQARGLAQLIAREEERDAMRRRDEAVRRAAIAERARLNTPPELRPVEETKTKRRLDW